MSSTRDLRRPTMRTGIGIIPSVLSEIRRDRSAMVIVDSRVPSHVIGERETAAVVVDTATADVATVHGVAARIRRLKPELVVAVGGGTVLDVAKLASLGAIAGRDLELVTAHAERSALTFIPRSAAGVDLVAVATTPGTSSETNSVAVLKNARGYRLVVGHQLRPRHTVLDGAALMSLSRSAIREACLEALLRTAGANTSPRGSVRAVSHSRTIGRALIFSGEEAEDSPARRLRIARLSAATQRTAVLRGRDPFAARHWYVANEVSFHLGVRKMSATATLIPAIWGRIDDGDARWGDSASLDAFWAPVARDSGLPEKPAEGIAHLVEKWGIELSPRPSGDAVTHIADVVESLWGGRQRALRGITARDVRGLLQESRWGPDSSALESSGRPYGRAPGTERR